MTKSIPIISEKFTYDYGNNIPPSINSPPNKNFFKYFICKIVDKKKPVREYFRDYEIYNF